MTDHAPLIHQILEQLAAGRCALALVVVAAGWTRLVDYADPGAQGVGDGAAAVVVSRGRGSSSTSSARPTPSCARR